VRVYRRTFVSSIDLAISSTSFPNRGIQLRRHPLRQTQPGNSGVMCAELTYAPRLLSTVPARPACIKIAGLRCRMSKAPTEGEASSLQDPCVRLMSGSGSNKVLEYRILARAEPKGMASRYEMRACYKGKTGSQPADPRAFGTQGLNDTGVI